MKAKKPMKTSMKPIKTMKTLINPNENPTVYAALAFLWVSLCCICFHWCSLFVHWFFWCHMCFFGVHCCLHLFSLLLSPSPLVFFGFQRFSYVFHWCSAIVLWCFIGVHLFFIGFRLCFFDFRWFFFCFSLMCLWLRKGPEFSRKHVEKYGGIFFFKFPDVF